MKPQLLYFIENETTGTQDLYRAVGLAHALAPSASYRGAQTGPGDQPGIVAAVEPDGLGYFPGNQTWHDLGQRDGRRVWLGWRADSARPGPAELATKHGLPGHQVRLFDGQEWTVPVALQFAEGQFAPGVPAALDVGPTGEFVRGAVPPQYARLWKIACDFWGRVLGGDVDGETVRFKVADTAKLAAEVLAVNYRVSLAECCKLGLFDTTGDVALRVLWAAIDWPTFEAWSAKKKDEEPSGG